MAVRLREDVAAIVTALFARAALEEAGGMVADLAVLFADLAE